MMNNYNNTSTEGNFLLLTRVRLIVKFYIWPLLVLFGLTGNCLSILVLTRRRLIRTSTNNYLTILAVADSCYLIFTLILNFGSHSTFSESSFTQTVLFFLRPLADFSSNTATWLIVCFTVERTLAVAKPIYAKRTCSVRRSRHLICILLISCFLITLPTYFENNFLSHVNNTDKQNHMFNTTDIKKSNDVFLTLHRLYLVFICVVIIWIPLTLLCICNTILIWYVHRSRRFDSSQDSPAVYESFSSATLPLNKHDNSSDNYHKSSLTSNISLKNPYSFHLRRHNRSYSQKRKVTIVLIFCLCLALLLWTPQSLSLTYETLIESYDEMSKEHRTILLIFNNFANLFICINASIDFILYCFLSEKFARTCKQIILRQCSHHKIDYLQRSRLLSFDRTSFIYINTSNNIHHHQQQLAANTTNNYYTQSYQFHPQSSMNEKKKKSKKKIVQTQTPPTTPVNDKIDNRVLYQIALIENKQKFLTVRKYSHQRYSIDDAKPTEILSNIEDDYITNQHNVELNTSISSNSNRQSHSDIQSST